MRLTLIRHAEPQAAIDRLVAGPKGCTGLSVRGRSEAATLAERLHRTQELRPQLVLTSVLPRAIETARALAPVIGAAQESCDLCELHPGQCDGESWDDHAYRYPSTDAPDRVFSEGGESLRTFDQRVRHTMRDLLDAHRGSNIVVVAHSGVIEAATLFLLGLPGLHEPRTFRIDSLQYTSITELELVEDGRWRLQRYNDHAHLLPSNEDLDGP